MSDESGWTISKTFRFDASHQLAGLPSAHKCSRLHGHTYAVTLTLAAAGVNGPGFVLDYADLAPFKRYVDEHLDHRHLGCQPLFDAAGKPAAEPALNFNPTAELLARHLCDVAAGFFGSLVHSVEVKETEATSAVWYR
jgi:6-pyruvoyltetrahydropterin/6-carboxytetrahydropterin synthase